jgi:potassium-transporting ATPase potassium-binding subunit
VRIAVNVFGWAQIGLVALAVFALVRPLGGYLARVYAGERTLLQPVLRPVETAFYRIAGVDPSVDQKWSEYAISLFVFSVAGTIALYLLLQFQNLLPLNPQHFSAMSPDLAINTAVSFVTNTS